MVLAPVKPYVSARRAAMRERKKLEGTSPRSAASVWLISRRSLSPMPVPKQTPTVVRDRSAGMRPASSSAMPVAFTARRVARLSALAVSSAGSSSAMP